MRCVLKHLESTRRHIDDSGNYLCHLSRGLQMQLVDSVALGGRAQVQMDLHGHPHSAPIRELHQQEGPDGVWGVQRALSVATQLGA